MPTAWACGLVYSPIERLESDLGRREVVVRLGENGYEFLARAPAGTEYDKDVYGAAFGIQYRFF